MTSGVSRALPGRACSNGAERRTTHAHLAGIELATGDRERARIGVAGRVLEAVGVERAIDPVQLVVGDAANDHLAPLEHLHVADQHGYRRALVEVDIARRYHHVGHAGDAHHVSVLPDLRADLPIQIEHLAAVPLRRLAIGQQAVLGGGQQRQPAQQQQRAEHLEQHAAAGQFAEEVQAAHHATSIALSEAHSCAVPKRPRASQVTSASAQSWSWVKNSRTPRASLSSRKSRFSSISFSGQRS
jgi:hypothetical protein